jgi:hypothetical protein
VLPEATQTGPKKKKKKKKKTLTPYSLLEEKNLEAWRRNLKGKQPKYISFK